jgi:hypothetical protein
MNEPVALRYDFDGHGYLYMDAGSGSDWALRVKDCEFLYTHPQRELSDDEIIEIADKSLPRWSCNSLDGTIIFARAIIKASRGEK